MGVKKTVGMYPTFERSGTPTRVSHYCGGCGHGIIHKLITEAVTELGITDRVVMANPIGCAVFGYYYWDVGNIGAAHGRAAAVCTAVSRTCPDAIALAYQGDGDLGAIGFNCSFQAANRGERMATFFVNNGTYGMTGGQMAPTSLKGQITATTPLGRDVLNDGYPLHVCEVLNQLTAPVYIERVSVADTQRIMQARRAIRKALELQRDGKGYAFVEILSPCPTNMRLDAVQAAQFTSDKMEQEFPLGVFRDQSATATAHPAPTAKPGPAAFFTGHPDGAKDAAPDPAFVEQRLKIAGFGGQGILSMGLCVAEAGRFAGRYTTWFPSYGPEQRGGTASCSVVVSGRPVGSPAVDHADVLVCMNLPAYERFFQDVKPGGWLIADASVPISEPPAGVRFFAFPTIQFATERGMPRSANTVMLAVLAACGVTGLDRTVIEQALAASLQRKPALVAKNLEIFAAAYQQTMLLAPAATRM